MSQKKTKQKNLFLLLSVKVDEEDRDSRDLPLENENLPPKAARALLL